MKVCTLATEKVSNAFAGWQRALDADRVRFEELLALLSKPERELGYDLVLVAVSPESLPWLEPLGRLLRTPRKAILVAWVEGSLPSGARTLFHYRAGLAAADLVLTPDGRVRRDIESKAALRALELMPPWFEAPPQSFTWAPEEETPSGRLLVASRALRTQGSLMRELGIMAYLWTRLRCRVEFCRASEAAARVSPGDLIYADEALEDGGELAARAAACGALLLCPRAYEHARFCFPFTTYGPERGSGAALLLWLHSAPALVATFKEHARHRARQLADGDRRLQLARTVQQQFPGFAHRSDPRRPSLLDQIRHISGPVDFDYAIDECVVVCLVRNGGEHLAAFLEHHRALGVRHFVFIDNGSDDGSRAVLEQQPDSTVYATSLPHKHYENELRRLIIEKHCQRRWCLCLDIDELFDYPGSDKLSLRELLRYLRRQGASAMVGYLLDMFARVNEFGEPRAVDLKAEYPCYDLTDVEKVGYFAPEIANFCDRNQLTAPGIGCYFGGIRRRVFGGQERAQFLLTKHPLIFLDGELQPVVHPHYSNRARLADVTAVLYHYKLTPSFKTKVRESVASNRYIEFAQRQYDEYHRQLETREVLVIDGPGRRTLRDAEQLLEEGFLYASHGFRALLRAGQARESVEHEPIRHGGKPCSVS